MGQNPTVEEIMQRIRARVAERNGGVASAQPGNGAVQDGNSRPAVSTGDPSHPVRLVPCDLSGLHAEIDVALEGTRRVGQLNPRNPGIINGWIQFLKKVMRRSLSWYTRPIHYFQGGAVRSLQQTEKVLHGFDRSMHAIAGELNRQSEAIATNSRILQSDFAEANERIASLDQSGKELSHRLDSTSHEFALLAEAQENRMSALDRGTSEVDRQVKQTQADLGQCIGRLDLIYERLRQQQQSQFTELNEKVRDLQIQRRLKDRDIRRFLHDLEGVTISHGKREESFPVTPMFPTGIHRERDFDYFAFEELHRGDEASIRERQRSYLDCFRGRQNVLDVGCGRGEFLELLRDNNITAKGVELGTDQYLLCQEKGLDVVQQDLFNYLESLPDQSLGGLFSAQVIEHLTASDQLHYVRLAYEKTMSGSPVIFETINAQCVWAVMRNFFLDPTHVRPIHPETLKFAMETVNFRDVELRFSSPMSDRIIPRLEAGDAVKNAAAFNQRIDELNLFLYGNQDYAAIGWH
jgi:O-antigen chain-terminating methyltransferase